jgi:hypothetical protein
MCPVPVRTPGCAATRRSPALTGLRVDGSWVSPSPGTSCDAQDAALVRCRVTSHGLSLRLERGGGVSVGLLHFPAGNIDLLGGDRVSDQAWQNSFYVALSASAHAAAGCVTACLEDFRGDLATISIPVLVRSLTAISQTGRTAPDSGVRDRHPADPDLRLRTLAHWPVTWH